MLLLQHFGATFDDFPHIKKYVDRVKARPAVSKVVQLHQQAAREHHMPESEVFKGSI